MKEEWPEKATKAEMLIYADFLGKRAESMHEKNAGPEWAIRSMRRLAAKLRVLAAKRA